MDLFVAGRDQSAANQPNNLAEGRPPLKPLKSADLQVLAGCFFIGKINIINIISWQTADHQGWSESCLYLHALYLTVCGDFRCQKHCIYTGIYNVHGQPYMPQKDTTRHAHSPAETFHTQWPPIPLLRPPQQHIPHKKTQPGTHTHPQKLFVLSDLPYHCCGRLSNIYHTKRHNQARTLTRRNFSYSVSSPATAAAASASSTYTAKRGKKFVKLKRVTLKLTCDIKINVWH